MPASGKEEIGLGRIAPGQPLAVVSRDGRARWDSNAAELLVLGVRLPRASPSSPRSMVPEEESEKVVDIREALP
jgi:hypothetical protein